MVFIEKGVFVFVMRFPYALSFRILSGMYKNLYDIQVYKEKKSNTLSFISGN